MRLGGQRHAPAAFPPEKTRHRFYRSLGVPQVRYGRVRKISPPPGFDPSTVQPVTSRYTVYAIPAPSLNMWAIKISRARIETVIRTEPNICYIWFVAAMLRQLSPFLLIIT
jgi:hypothetical protein